MGRIRQLRRGLYTFAPPYQAIKPHPFIIANALVPGSYVSGQSALAYYGLIPEYAPRTISMTLARTSDWYSEFTHHHLARHLFFGYRSMEVVPGQSAFVAFPEKALLDLAHLTSNSDSPDYLSELRLQNLETLDLDRLLGFAERSRKPKWRRVAGQIAEIALQEKREYGKLT
jgi:predicted transcriptional regulator of viral defense system